MATTGDIISRALRLIGVAVPGQALSGADSDTGLEALNALVDSLGLSRHMVPSLTEETFSLVNGTADYTIGASMTLNTVMPIKVDESSYVTIGDLDYPLTVINGTEWADIPDKASTGSIPETVYFKRGQATGSLRFYPAPGAGVSLKLRSWKTFAQYADTATDLGLPAGFDDMLAFNLAVRLAPEYGKEAPATVQRIAFSTASRLKGAQAEIPKLDARATRKSDILVDG